MFVLGITGGIASGKSFVAGCLRDHAALVLDADRVAHEVLRQPEIIEAVRQRWGDGVLDATGQIDRKSLAKIVFAPPPQGPQERGRLERLTHPAVLQSLRDRIAQATATGEAVVVVLDVPLLFEVGADSLCDRTIFVESPREVRLQYALKRGWTETEFTARESAQWPPDKKRKQANLIIDNSGSPEATRQQIDTLWHELFHS